MVESELIPAPEEVAAALGVLPGSDVLKVVRVRSANGEPVLIERTFFPPQIAALLANEDLGTVAFYPLLEEKHGIFRASIRDTIRAAQVSHQDATLLDVPKHSPVLIVDEVSYTTGRVPIEVGHHTYRADRYSYGVWLHRDVGSMPSSATV